MDKIIAYVGSFLMINLILLGITALFYYVPETTFLASGVITYLLFSKRKKK